MITIFFKTGSQSSHQTQSNLVQSMDGSNPCPTLSLLHAGKVTGEFIFFLGELITAGCAWCRIEYRSAPD